MKKHLVILSSVALTASILGATSNVAFAETTDEPVTEETQVVDTLTIVEEFDEETGQEVAETITSSENMDESLVGENSDEVEAPLPGEPVIPVKPGDPQYSNVNPGSMNYKLIDTFTGNSSIYDTLKEWTSQFAACVIPARFVKNVWASAAGSATYNTFHNPPKTRYYTDKIYQAQDAVWNYGKSVGYEYSDKAKTKLTRKVTHVNKTRH
ncbi:hypothetical protein [Fictibacillus sp. S7]|uniref:hypothetical protein n=1 Tax=Fictibacillus sp. S7 TaxID=2212476 RepID=UPI00101354CA|nr:hypothetical protein [Fictibacillus sp. S7]RXY98885.1 hypothetical protein DMO16_03905 [Fictibacillus sp. S7]